MADSLIPIAWRAVIGIGCWAMMAPSGVRAQDVPTLAGVIRDTDGRPIEGVEITLRSPRDQSEVTTHSNARGEFSYAVQDTGAWLVVFHKPGFHPTQYSWPAGPRRRQEIHVTLQLIDAELDPVLVLAREEARLKDRASLVGLIVDENGRGIADASVNVLGADLALSTSDDGTFAARSLAARPYTIRVRKIGYEPIVTSLTLMANEHRELAMTLRRLPVGLPDAVVLSRSGFGSQQTPFAELAERLRWHTFTSWALSRDDLRYQEGAPLDLVAKELGVYYVDSVRAKRNLLTRGVTSINVSPNGQVSHPILPDGPPHVVTGYACMLIDGVRSEYGPLRAYAAKDLDFMEIYPSGTEVTSTVAAHMHGPCHAMSVLQHPTYFVLWLKRD